MGNHVTEIIAIWSQLPALYLLAYAGLERWRERSLGRYKNCQENQQKNKKCYDVL